MPFNSLEKVTQIAFSNTSNLQTADSDCSYWVEAFLSRGIKDGFKQPSINDLRSIHDGLVKKAQDIKDLNIDKQICATKRLQLGYGLLSKKGDSTKITRQQLQSSFPGIEKITTLEVIAEQSKAENLQLNSNNREKVERNGYIF